MVGPRTLVITAILAFGLGLCSTPRAQTNPPDSGTQTTNSGSVRSATVVTVHGKIIKVDKARKLVTIEGPEGRKATILVENPRNLDAAKVGDSVVVRFFEIVSVRKKRANENVPTASLREGIATAKPGGLPGAVLEQKLQLLLTVEAIDRANGTVTVKAGDGTDETVKARNPNNLKHLKVGDELVVTLERAVGISIEKEKG